MDARTKWPGGALARADRAGMEMQGAFLPEHRLNHRQMQAAKLCRSHGLNRQRALLIAELHFGDIRE